MKYCIDKREDSDEFEITTWEAGPEPFHVLAEYERSGIFEIVHSGGVTRSSFTLLRHELAEYGAAIAAAAKRDGDPDPDLVLFAAAIFAAMLWPRSEEALTLGPVEYPAEDPRVAWRRIIDELIDKGGV